ncbi:nucleic acid-binding, OB-fold, replication protein A, OB domain protein [Tanacetum coccineum]
MVLMDEEGCKIHASVKKTLVFNFDSHEQGQCYCLSDFGMPERYGKHHVVAHKYRIYFYWITKVTKCDDIGGSLFGFDFRPFESVRNKVQPSTVAYDVICEVVSCGSLDYPIIEGKSGVGLSITLRGPYAEQVDAALGYRTKMRCHACNFGVDTKTNDYKDEESGFVKNKTSCICKNKSCGEVSHVLYKFKIQIRVFDKTGSVLLTLFDRLVNTLLDNDASELVEKQQKVYILI